MKLVRRILLALLLVVIIGVVVTLLYLDGIIRSTVQNQATDSLNLKTTLDSAHLSLLGGNLSLNELNVGSPQGYAAPQMLGLGKLAVAVKYSELTRDPIRIESISIERPRVVLEQNNGQWNFKVLMDQQPAKPAPTAPATGEKRPEGQPIRVIIGQLDLKDAQVVVRPGADMAKMLGGKEEITINIPSITLKNIGNADGANNGAALKDVAMQVITALGSKATSGGALQGMLKDALQQNLNQVAGKLSAEFNKQIGNVTSQLGDKLPPDLKNAIPGGAGDAASKEIDKATKGLGGLLGGGNKDKDKNK